MIVIGDVHGCFDTLMALIAQLPKDIPYCMVGDLVDRGPKNRDVVDFVRKNKIPCVTGNHELLMQSYDWEMRQCWMMNGGGQTSREYDTVTPIGEQYDMYVNPPSKVRDVPAFEDDIKWMRKLPLYLEFPEIIRESDGRH